MVSIVACCRGVKLCPHAALDFRSQQNGAVTRMWRSCRDQPSHKESAIGVVMGAIWWETRGTYYAMSPHFFLLGFVFGEVSKLNVTLSRFV